MSRRRKTEDVVRRNSQFGAPAFLRSPLILSLVLCAGTLVLYLPALQNTFLIYDDDDYVTANAHVLHALSWSNVKWAFTTTEEANWHPLTWISHMADVQFFGLDPHGHHLTSIVLHALNVVLLFLVLFRATSEILRSAAVAALFAVHPLNVDCVAWVAERKSLLSMFFLLLALAAYERYAKHRGVGRYVLVAFLFAAGLAAKPMIVTLPILFLLCDYWPLRRLAGQESRNDGNLPALIAEKIPLLALSAASSWITLYAQRKGGAFGLMDALPLPVRVTNAIYSYLIYLVKAVWPSRLAVFYPHPESSLVWWKVLAAAILLILITVLVWISRERHRYLLTGWLWYLVAMIPMIGVVQAGMQAMADRYAYLPFVGLFIIAIWGVSALFAMLRLSHSVRFAVAGAAIIAYASVAFLQLPYWRNSYALFSHATQVTSRNGIAEDHLGVALGLMGRTDLALPHFQAAITFMPHLSTAHYNLARAEQQQGDANAALREYKLALQYASDPRELAKTHNNLGFLLLDLGDPRSALEQFTAAVQIDPNRQNSLLGRGIAEYLLGTLDAALIDLSQAARIQPHARADFWLGRVLEDKGQIEAAISWYDRALQLAPAMTEARQRRDALQAAH